MIAYPVIAAHRVEAICATYEDQIIIPGDEHFNEIVTFILRDKSDEENITHYTTEKNWEPFFNSYGKKGKWFTEELTLRFPFKAHVSLSPWPDLHVNFCYFNDGGGEKNVNTHFSISSLSFMRS